MTDVDGDGFTDAGDTIDYTFAVTNTGNVTLTDPSVTDPMLKAAGIGITCPTGALAPGDTITVDDLDDALAQSPPSGDDDWDARLRAWARAQLADGAEHLHASARERFDRALLQAALEHTGGRRSEAAARLGLGRNTLTRKLGPGRTRG